jgi:peptidoglycan hydrolase-like protein with peptidoglycan-binding domain
MIRSGLSKPRASVFVVSAAICTAALTLGASSCGSSRATPNALPPTPTVSSGPTTPVQPTTTTVQPTTTTVQPTTTTEPTTTTTTDASKQGSASDLRLGDRGPAVLAVQTRLTALGYWLGTPDGSFEDSTEQAVYAFQKAAGLTRDGVIGPKTAAALRQGVVPRPRSTSGRVIEIDLGDDLMMFVDNGKLDYVLNTSTGGGYTYTDGGVTARAITPEGVFHISRQVDGVVTDSLGQLWRPKFFEGGFAIHGDGYVPPYPVSHGCARVSNEAIDWIWADNEAPIGTKVWVY